MLTCLLLVAFILLCIQQVLASNLDRALLKNGVVLDTVSHLSVLYIEADPEVDESVGNSTNAANGFANTDTTTATATNGDVPSKRRNDGGKLQVNLLVRGHYNRNLNVNFDLIVQDSINRETHAIRRQLTYYNLVIDYVLNLLPSLILKMVINPSFLRPLVSILMYINGPKSQSYVT